MRTEVIVCIDVEGFHCWPDAPVVVAFLRSIHRHVFKIKAAYVVTHDDRDKEIFIERDNLREFVKSLQDVTYNFGSMSCEMIAKKILTRFTGHGMTSCEVYEEETGGARVSL